MNACIFILTINAMMPVYGADRTAQVDQLSIGDQVCVTRIEAGDWMQIHWSSGNVGHTGFLHEINVKQPGQPTEPTQHEEEYNTPAPAPQLPEPPLAPPTPQNHSNFRGPTLPDTFRRGAALVMQCFPQGGTPYAVVYVNGHAAVVSNSGKTTRQYTVTDEQDNQNKHVFYVRANRDDQDRTLYFAFDYFAEGNDVSAIRVKGPGYDARDKCAMDWATMREAAQ